MAHRSPARTSCGPGMSFNALECAPLDLARDLGNLRVQSDHGAPKGAIRALRRPSFVVRSGVRAPAGLSEAVDCDCGIGGAHDPLCILHPVTCTPLIEGLKTNS
jgi:hypothetical protein